MTDVQLRDMTIDDVPDAARIRIAAHPWTVASVENQRNWFRVVRPEARPLRLVAVAGGEVVGVGTGGFNMSTTEEAAAEVYITVHPQARRRGIGVALYEQVEAHLRAIGANRVRAYCPDDEADLRWAAARGYAQGARDRFSEVGTANLPPMPPIPAGVELISIAKAGPEAVYELDMAASIDEPGDVAYDGVPYDLWLDRYWHSPDMQHEASTVVLVDGVAACGTFLEGDLATGRCMSTGTCTRREFRGRGLAKLAKSWALRRAHEVGLHTAGTWNDYTNGPMVAVNDWLGYRVTAGEWSMIKQL